jgi:NTP pyrophosphatase (non-canonical NTP hydrolase)
MSILKERWDSYTEKEQQYLTEKCREATIAVESNNIELESKIKNELEIISNFHFNTKSNNMTIQEYQQYVKDGASPKYTKEIAILGLMGELGELSDVVKKETIYHDMSKFEAKYGMSVKDKIKDELGDVLWYLTNIANELGISIEDIAKLNLTKLYKRKENGTIQGNGDNR